MHRKLWLILSASVVTCAASAQPSVVFDCPRTVSPTGDIGHSAIWGSDSFAVLIPPNGIWNGLGREGNFRNKVFWFSYGFRPEVEPSLRVTGRRLDAEAPPAMVSTPTNAGYSAKDEWAMLVAVEFPSAGCWEISGEYLGQRISYVVEVLDRE